MKTIKLILTISVIFIVKQGFSQDTHTYQYDTESRLINSKDGIKTQTYQYDKLDNRLGYKLTSTVVLPDLTISAINSSAITLTQEQETTVMATINNSGSTIVQSSILKVYLSATATNTDVEVGSFVVPTINANSNKEVSFKINIPNNATLGNRFLVFYIDAIKAIQETDETNNTNNIVVTINAPDVAELNIQNAALNNTTVVAGDNLELTASIFNSGTANASVVTVKAYLSSNTTLEVNDIPLTDANETISALNAGTNLGYNKTVVIPSNSVTGNYYVLFAVDKENTVSELDETNNVVGVPLTIKKDTALPIANFSVESQTLSASNSVQFTDQSINAPISWVWSFPGGTPSTSTLQNPSVTYNTEGVYDVTLKVFNANGEAQEYKNEYITVTTNTASLTYVPDDNFEQALIDFGYDSGALDDYVPTTNITAVTSLDIASKNITNLTGIQDFQSLQVLDVSNNQITNINLLVSSALLEEFNCSNNNLNALNISSNVNLKKLDASNNQFTTLDASTNVKLTSVLLNNNLLESLNIKNTTNAIISEFNVINNTTNLCIQVDNATDASNGTGNYATWQKDVSAQYSESCEALSVLQEELISSILVYPNPTKAFLKIQVNDSLKINKVIIYDVLGKEILKRTKNYNLIDISKYSNGTYFLKIKTDKGSVIKKIIKD
ncbi:CARDB domain-containing protein [uncultured Polaribacter sp.]|uniref:CARDB domain-containing protein n=1 Tax=uncultured Polaribacter sp. TaxID=174711 RepID=UPI002629908D|nr:CARDB domain-containing protein [uncultured Polaribacter sp.]